MWHSIRILCSTRRGNEPSGSFQKASDPDEDDGADESNNDRANHSSSRPDSQAPKDPATQEAAKDAEKDVHDDAVAATLHDESREPAGDKTDNDPIDHALPPLMNPGDGGDM